LVLPSYHSCYYILLMQQLLLMFDIIVIIITIVTNLCAIIINSFTSPLPAAHDSRISLRLFTKNACAKCEAHLPCV